MADQEQAQAEKSNGMDETWHFFRSRIFVIAILLQIIAPFLVTFGNWANIIQYVSGFGMAYALWEYFHVHKPTIRRMEDQMFHLHKKTDLLHEKQDLLHKKQDELYASQRTLNDQQDRMTEKEEVTHQKQDQINAEQNRVDEQMQVH